MRSLLALTLALVGCAATPARPQAPSPSTAAGAIVQAGTPVLRQRAAEVPPERIATPEIQALIRRMIDAMRAAPGVGLAAPQLGVPLRIFVAEDRPELLARLTPTEIEERARRPFPVRVFVNPIVRPVGEARAGFFEGCLSVRGYVGDVERALDVEVSYLDEHGQPQTWQVHGWPARILQHELDHLDGTLYIDRMATRSFANADLARARFGGRPIAEIRAALGLAEPPR